MSAEASLFQIFIYLLAAVVSVPIAKRLGLGSVLGYLLAGAAIGPSALRLVGGDGHSGQVMDFAGFGVVMMLFLIGLELRPSRLWELRGPVLGMGGLQVAGTAIVIVGVIVLGGGNWKMGLAAGLILAMSSTAIVLQSLGEKGLLKTPGGEACFSVLLFQDLSVIPIFAVLPLLSTRAADHAGSGHEGGGPAWLASLPGWVQGLVTLGAVAVVILGGRFALRPIFRYIAATGLREVFTAMTLLLVVGIALLMKSVGLSPGLGTFLAGVVLADSEYRHQLEADIEPFKGLLLGLFFISVGADIKFAIVRDHPAMILGLVAGLLTLKFLVLLALGRGFKLATTSNLLFAFALAQAGEFAFVLITFCSERAILPPAWTDPMNAVVALSMAVTPLLLVINEKLVQPRLAPATEAGNEREPDRIDPHPDGGVILAGFGRFGHIVGRLLMANGVPTTVLEHDADWVETLREFGMKTYYGDATREDLLRSAGAEHARLFIIALDNQEKSLELVDTVRKEFPHLTILARAVDRTHAYELIRHGLAPEHVYRETLGTSLDLSIDALRLMGFRATQAARAAKVYRTNDANSVRALAALYGGDRSIYVSAARQSIENLENVLQNDLDKRFHGVDDRGWDGPPSPVPEPET